MREQADLVLTSPPYGGTYDYIAHHARRFAWLDMDTRNFARSEIGARRHPGEGERFEKELFAVMRAARSVMRRSGYLVMLMGDARHGTKDVAADELVAELAEQVGLKPVAIATQGRADHAGGAPRGEHLMALTVA